MAKLIIKTEVVGPNTEVKKLVGNMTLGINMFVPVSVESKRPVDFISKDDANAIVLGSDDKLLVNKNEKVSTDFSAYYILARG